MVRIGALLLLAALPCFAQDLPDPGRRLTPEEEKADPEHPIAKPPAAAPHRSEREERACKNARINYQNSCGASASYRSYRRDCAEAYALYRQSCP